MNQVPMNEIVNQIEEMLAVRGNSPNAISQYHYIFTVMLAFFNSYRQKFYSKELMERCLKEHYDIIDYDILSRRQHYKKKVIRASRMIEDIANGCDFKDRYLLPCSQSLENYPKTVFILSILKSKSIFYACCIPDVFLQPVENSFATG